MPAVSKKQQIAMAIAEHQPSKLYKRNKGLKKMSKGQLHDFAATKRSKLPMRVHDGHKPHSSKKPNSGIAKAAKRTRPRYSRISHKKI